MSVRLQLQGRLNGRLTDGGFCGGSTCDVWFVYDTSSHSSPSEYSFSTPHQTMSSTGTYNEMIYGLDLGTRYYFRACASNDASSDYGDEISFLTWGACYTWEDADGDGPGTTIDFNASCSCGDNSITNYDWDWDSDGTYDHYDTDPFCSNDYGDTYQHNCTLRITNTDGQTDTIVHTVKAKVKITADANGPYYGFVGTSIQFIGSASGGTPPYNWNWDFGDGNTSNEQTPIQTYNDADYYNVVLSVTDNFEGSDDDATYADIQPAGGNHPPIANDDNATVEEDSLNNQIDVLDNDYDPNWDDIDIIAVTPPPHGTVTFNPAYVYYTPDSNYNGEDQFEYTIDDGNGGNATATVYVFITPLNDDPVAIDDAATVTENSTNNEIDVLLNDYDIDGDDLEIIDVSTPSYGTTSYTADYVYYTPDFGHVGSDQFNYTISDGNGGTSSAIVLMTIAPVEADLDCYGDIHWVDVEPGSTVTSYFTVENIGDPSSGLFWAVSEYPGWGTWTFTPNGGADLTPEDEPVIVNVDVVAPNNQNEEYSGIVKIVNIYNSNDYCEIQVSLATPVSQQIDMHPLFQRILERFPNAFPILRYLLGL